jgi:hypothetical protein
VAFTGVLVRWSLEEADIAAAACRLLDHRPTRAEWAERFPENAYVEICTH